MSDDNNADGTSQEGDGTQSGSQSQSGTSQPDELSLARRRQAGAEAARQAAEARAAALEAELAPLRDAAKTAAQKDLDELARERARADAAEAAAKDAETKAMAKVLDKLYPNARKELPEVTDEVRLAKFEALLADGEAEPPTPLRHNENKSGAGAAAGGAAKPESAADVKARLLATPMPEGWGS